MLQSSDEEFEYDDGVGEGEDEEIYISDSEGEAAPVQQHYQPSPPPVPNARAARVPQPAFAQAQQYMNPNAFQAGFGGHAFARPPASAFRRQYKAYSTAILEIQQGRSYNNGARSNLMYGGKSQFFLAL